MNSDLIVYSAHNNDEVDNYSYPRHYLYISKNCNEIIIEDKSTIRNDGTIATGEFYAPGEELTKDNYGIGIGVKDL